MKTHGILRGLKFLLFVTLAATVFGFVVMWLWNWLMPAIFGLHLISFWQALGLLVLSKILFSGFRGPARLPRRLADAPDPALGRHDPGGTGQVPSRHARGVWSLCAPRDRTEGVAEAPSRGPRPLRSRDGNEGFSLSSRRGGNNYTPPLLSVRTNSSLAKMS